MTQLIQPPPAPVASGKKLYTSTAVGIAAFLGSVFAGTAVMAVNYRRMKQPGNAYKALAIGALATAAMVSLAMVLPDHVRTLLYGLSIAAIIATARAARVLQGPAIEAHLANGGQTGSSWFGALVGLIGLVLVFSAIVGAAYLSADKHVEIGASEVYYSGAATEADAKALGAVLKESGYFGEHASTVKLRKDANGTTLSFVVREGSWDQPKSVAAFGALAKEVAPSVGGLPVTVRMLDTDIATKKEWQIR